MKTKSTEEDDILKSLFRLMPEEKMSSAFQQDMMLRIQHEAIHIRKRSAFLRICALSIASLLIIGLAIASFIYLDMPEIQLPAVSILPFYLFLGIVSLFLLFIDYLFRKRYYKKHPELK